jgi:outer membrane receptor protein involved in Fe transport
MMNRVIWTIILFLNFTVFLYAQVAEKGKLAGQVTDKNTGENLAGVNVEIKGTYMGAASDVDGFYFINDINPGEYDVEVSIIGYKIQLVTGITIQPGETESLNFELEESILAFGEEIEVIGQKPLLETDLTASQESFSSDDIGAKIVENVDEILVQQAGVVKNNNEIHIRGGRADENLYIIDGVSVKDPLSGFGNTTYINKDAIKELKVITGGFNAEYGQAMSGIIDVVTKEGGDRYTGGLSVKTDNFGLGTLKNYNTQIFEFNIGGPELITKYLLPELGLDLPGSLSLFFSGYGRISDTYLPIANKLYPSRSSLDMWAPRQENDWHILGKITWKLNPSQKISFSYDRSLNINQGYFRSYVISRNYFPYDYSKHLDNYPTFTSETILGNISWKHTVSNRTFYEISLGKFYNSTNSSVQNKPWELYEEYQDLAPINYSSDNEGNLTIRRGDGFYDYGDYGQWYNYFSDRLSIRADITSQLDEHHQIKGGFDVAATEMQVVDIIDPWVDSESGFGRSHDIYNVDSYNGALYVQDQIKYDGMILNLGMRYDFWFPGKFVQEAIDDPETIIITDQARKLFYDETYEFFGLRGKGHLSPRLGISHPVTDHDVLYFHYGHFSQIPKGQYVYAKLKATSPATYQLFGNPNLNPTTTVAYEIGVKHKFNENLVMEVRAYYKDMFDYASSERIEMENPRLGNISYLMYINMDYARSKGIELRLKQRYSEFLTGNLNFNYAVTKGKSSTPNDNLLVEAGRLSEKPLKENYLSWDRPMRVTLDLTLNIAEGKGWDVLGWFIFDKWGLSLHWELESGKRYTELLDINKEIYDDANPYAQMAPYWHQMDFRFNKYFSMLNVNWSFQVEVENVFDASIPRIINPDTGLEYRPGDPLTNSYTREINPLPNPITNPAKFRWPRTIRFGMSLNF